MDADVIKVLEMSTKARTTQVALPAYIGGHWSLRCSRQHNPNPEASKHVLPSVTAGFNLKALST